MKLKSRWYYRILGGHAVKTTRVLITDTQASREDLVCHVGASQKRVHVIYPGLRPIFRIYREPAALDRVRQLYGLPNDFILFVGTLEPRKNLRRILAAFRMLKDQHEFKPALVIVGRKGWLYNPIFSELSSHELAQQVHLTGTFQMKTLSSYITWPVCLSSRPCMKDLACPALKRWPVDARLCSNSPAQCEVTGDAAVQIDPEDVSAISAAIWQVDNDEELRLRLTVNGLRRAASFSWAVYASQFLDVIDSAVGVKYRY